MMLKPRALGMILSLLLILTAVSCGEREPSYEDRETFAGETYVTAGDVVLTTCDGLTFDVYPEGTPTGDWLKGCSASDRDEQFDAYVLRHESAAAGHTTFTYLVYYPHEGSTLSLMPTLLEGESGYILELACGSGSGVEGYSLCYLSVTLPTDKAPRVRLMLEKDILGVLSTVTVDPIPSPEGN